MDLDKALAAHADWKVKLRVALANAETLDAERIGSDNCCDLGRWLHGDGRKRFGRSASFLACVGAHKEFHTAAGSVARRINAKAFSDAEQMLGPGSSFAAASSSVAVAVRRLKNELSSLAS